MRFAFFVGIVGLFGSSAGLAEDTEEPYEYVAELDPLHVSRVLAARTVKEARKLGGVFGLCAMDVHIPNTGALVCDPPDRLPQICTLACKKGYYSAGQHRDIACADAMCEGQCIAQKYECKGAEIKFATRPCEYMRYTTCEETASSMCIETVNDLCTYSYYEDVSRPCCNITQVAPPEGCWTSGCTGSCESGGGVFHYFSSGCGDVCPPWRDPETPQFACAPCTPPTSYPPNTVIVSNADGVDPPSQITVSCAPGYWGTSVQSYCMTTDGSFYPPVTEIRCEACSAAPILEGDRFATRQVDAGSVEFYCLPGFVGETTFSSCNKETGMWSFVEPPYCDVAPTPSITPSATPVVSLEGLESLEDLENIAVEDPSATPTPTSTPTVTATPTPSASKSPRPPKVKGSRAPTQPPKLRPRV